MSRYTPRLLTFVLALVGACIAATNSLPELVTTGDRLYERGDHAGALRLFIEIKNAATNDSPVQLRATARIAECQYALGHYSDALRSYDELLIKWPRGGRRYFPELHMGDCLVVAGRTNEAVAVYKIVNKEYPTSYHVDIQSRIEQMRQKGPKHPSEDAANRSADRGSTNGGN